jgi:hypothetical protein
MVVQPIDVVSRGGFENGLTAIGINLTITWLQNINPNKDLPLGRFIFPMRTAVLIVILFGWVCCSFGGAVETLPVENRLSGDLPRLQASEQVANGVNSDDEAELETRQILRDRIVGFAIIFLGLLLLLGLSFIYLRLDHATRGFHAGRLQLLAAFLGLTVLGICFFFWNQMVLSNP